MSGSKRLRPHRSRGGYHLVRMIRNRSRIFILVSAALLIISGLRMVVSDGNEANDLAFLSYQIAVVAALLYAVDFFLYPGMGSDTVGVGKIRISTRKRRLKVKERSSHRGP